MSPSSPPAHSAAARGPARWALWASLALCAVAYGFVLLLIAVLALYAVPVADDFCYAAQAVDFGLFGAVVDEYNSWSGRYSSTWLMAWFALNADLVADYWLVTLTVMLALGGGVFVFLWTVLRRLTLALALCVPLLIIMILSLPKPGEVLFWLAGGATYGISAGVLLVWISGMIAVLRRTQPLGGRAWVLAGSLAGLAAILAGFQESMMTMLIATSALFLLASLLLARPASLRAAMFGIFVVAFIAGLVVVQNPGASERASNHAFAGSLILTPLVQLLLLIVAFTLAVPAQLGVWASALGLSALWPSRRDGDDSNVLPKRTAPARRTLAWLGIGASAVLAAGALAPAWGIGGPPSPRAMTPLYLFACLSVFLALLALTPTIRAQAMRLGWNTQTRTWALAAILALHALAVFSSDFVGQGVTNLIIGGVTPAAEYRAQWYERFDQIARAKAQGQDSLALAPLRHMPSLLQVTDIGPPGGWTSNCFSAYWDMDSIHLAP